MSYSLNTPCKFVIIHPNVSSWFNNLKQGGEFNFTLVFTFGLHFIIPEMQAMYKEFFRILFLLVMFRERAQDDILTWSFTNTQTYLILCSQCICVCVCVYIHKIHQLFYSLFIYSTALYKVFSPGRWMWGRPGFWEDGWCIPRAWRIRQASDFHQGAND